MNNKIRVGITMGDPSGIGPEIIVKALEKVQHLAEFVLIGDRWVFNQLPAVRFINLCNIDHKKFRFGKVSAEYGRASIEYLDKAMELIKAKKIDCLVTAPISKEAINLAGFKFNGHTEYLKNRTKTKDIVMMLLNKQLKFSLVTRHIALKDVSASLKKRNELYKTILITHKSLRDLFSICNPHLVVCGINPHASDNGLIGNEENQMIKPVLARLRKVIKYIDGPLPADIAIKKANSGIYDCVIAMYHDQALIPLKLTGNDTGVNITLGLPFIRTSPLHGTAFDIAGTNIGNPSSMIEAIRVAVECTLNQKKV
ncbi:MAG: 4-hydroxythreonine-4-phosphate dehydrogenase PdxA [Candidatus Omnitrophota bacterium]